MNIFVGLVTLVALSNNLTLIPEFDDAYSRDIIKDIVPKEETVKQKYLLAWYRFLQKNNEPRSEKVLLFVKTQAKEKVYYYLLVMDRGITRTPKYWNINWAFIEFQVFRPFRRYKHLPTNNDIKELLEYSGWRWEGIECRFGIFGKVEESNWRSALGMDPIFEFNNDTYHCK